MRAIIAILAAIILGGATFMLIETYIEHQEGSPEGVSVEREGWMSYDNQNLRFRLEHPDDMNKAMVNENTVLFYSGGDPDDDVFRDGLSFYVRKARMEGEDMLDHVSSSIDSANDHSVMTEPYRATISGYDGYVYSLESDAGSFREVYTVFTDDGTVFEITAVIADPGGSGYQETAMNMLDSFRVLK